MSSTFYGNRRFFQSKYNSLNVSPHQNLHTDIDNIITKTQKQRTHLGMHRSFSLQGKSKENLNFVKDAHLAKAQHPKISLPYSQRDGKEPRVEKSTKRFDQKSPHVAPFGSFTKQTSIDDSSISMVDYSIFVHGYVGVGKSKLVHQLPHVFSANEIFDIGRENREELFVNNNSTSYHVKEIDVMYKGKFKDADIHLVVFALDDIASMTYAIDRVTFLRWKCRIQCPIFIIGNKSDKMRRKPNFERDVEFITRKLDCQYVRMSDILSDNISILKTAIDSVFIQHKEECCTPSKKKIFKRIFKCFFTRKTR